MTFGFLEFATSESPPVRKSMTKTKYDLAVELLQLIEVYPNIALGTEAMLNGLKVRFETQTPAITNDKKFWSDFPMDSKEVIDMKKNLYKVMFNLYFSVLNEKELQDLIIFMSKNSAGQKLMKIFRSTELVNARLANEKKAQILLDTYVKKKMSPNKNLTK